MISACLILPAEHQTAGNAVSVALGHDVAPGSTYSVPLSANGQEPATHYGARAWITPGFAVMLGIVKTGIVPDGAAQTLSQMALGVRQSQPDMCAALIADIRETDEPYPHWTDVLTAHGLSVIQSPVP